MRRTFHNSDTLGAPLQLTWRLDWARTHRESFPQFFPTLLEVMTLPNANGDTLESLIPLIEKMNEILPVRSIPHNARIKGH